MQQNASASVGRKRKLCTGFMDCDQAGSLQPGVINDCYERSVSKDGHTNITVFGDRTSEHAFGIEGHGQVTVPVESDQAPFTACNSQRAEHDVIGCLSYILG